MSEPLRSTRGEDPSDRTFLDEMARLDFRVFVERVFLETSPGTRYVPNWHIDAIAWALMKVRNGTSRRLVINQPPRSMKSLCASIAFPAWLLGLNPAAQIICVSYSRDLAVEFHANFRKVVESEWYRRIFPQMTVSYGTKNRIETSKGGVRVATSIEGTLTGRGADVIILDDPMKGEDSMSAARRRNLDSWFRNTLLSRLDDKRTGRMILVMQRLHMDDLAGQLLAKPDWDRLILPAIAPMDLSLETGPGEVHQWREGEALQPIREPLDILDRLRADMTEFHFQSQYLQQPVPAEGNLVKSEWLNYYDHLPEREEFDRIIQSWDIAQATGEHNDWSVCTTWLVRRKGRDMSCFLVDVWRGRLAYPYLRDKLVELSQLHKVHEILIEDANNGTAVLDELRRNKPEGMPVPLRITPRGSKEERLSAITSDLRNGTVLLPSEAPWLDSFRTELLAFPAGRYDDQVDSLSQFIIWATKHLAIDDDILNAESLVSGFRWWGDPPLQ